MTQASLVEFWAEGESADRFRQETVEELHHAERIVKRMLTLGVAPAASQLRPVTHAGESPTTPRPCASVLQIGDAEQQAFFQTLWLEEQQHGHELATWLASLQSPGLVLPQRTRL